MGSVSCISSISKPRQRFSNLKEESRKLSWNLSSLKTQYDQTRAEIGNNFGLRRQLREGKERIERNLDIVAFRKRTLFKLISENKKKAKNNKGKKS